MACIYKTILEVLGGVFALVVLFCFFLIEVYLDSVMVILTPNHAFPNIYVSYWGIG